MTRTWVTQLVQVPVMQNYLLSPPTLQVGFVDKWLSRNLEYRTRKLWPYARLEARRAAATAKAGYTAHVLKDPSSYKCLYKVVE